MSVPVQLATLRWGNRGPRVLLLHGLTSSARGWWRLGAEIARAGHMVTAPDLRGHGGSPRGDDYLLDSFVADVLELGGKWDLVVGHSLGGAIAALAEATMGGFARQLVLEDPLLSLVDPDGFVAEYTASFEDPSARTILAQNPRWHPQDARIKSEALDASSPAVVRATVAQNLPWDLAHVVRGLGTPTLLLGADPARGALLDRATGDDIAQGNPHVTFAVIAGAGHSIHRDSYGPFWEVLGRRLPRAPGTWTT